MDDTEQTEQTVNLVDKEGEVVSIPSSQAAKAMQSYGYRPPTPQEQAEVNQRVKFGEGKANEFKAGALGAAGTFTLGAVPWALAKTGVVPSEEQAALAKYNPEARMVGQGLGLAGSVAASVLTGGASAGAQGIAEGAAATEGAVAAAGARLGLMDLLNPIGAVSKVGKIAEGAASPLTKGVANLVASKSPVANQILANAGRVAVGSGVESALFGLGNALDEHALGDTEALGEHLLPQIGLSTALGVGIGGALGAFGGLFKGLKNKAASEAVRKAAIRDAIAEQATQGVTREVPKPITDIASMEEAVKGAKYEGVVPGELPAKQRLLETEQIAPSDIPITNLQLESLSNQNANNIYQTVRQSTSKEGQLIRDYESLQKSRYMGQLNHEIQEIAPGKTLAKDPMKGGEEVLGAFTKQHEEEKKALAPFFKQFDEAGTRAIENPEELVNIIEKSLPEASKHISVGADGIVIAPYKPSMPFSKDTYGAIKELIEHANDPEATIGGLRNIRENWRDLIDFHGKPKSSSEIARLRTNVMQHLVDKIPEGNFRETAKRYAINEQNREIMERIFGGSISDKATFGKAIKSPDEILKHIFQNPANVAAAKAILPADVFNKAIGDFISVAAEQATDRTKNGFSSAKFATFLRTKEAELASAFGDNRLTLERLKAMADRLKILPDAPPINPSGTAKTLTIMEAMHKLGATLLHPMEGAHEGAAKLFEHFTEKLEQTKQRELLNQVLSGKSFADATKAAEDKMMVYGVLKHVEDTKKAATNAVIKKSAAIFKDPESLVGFGAAKLANKAIDRQQKHKDIRHAALNMTSDPAKFIDHLHESTQGIAAAAPSTAQSYQSTVARAANFLASKAPQPTRQTTFSPEFIPSNQELAKFERYHNVVDDPHSVLDHVKSATITPEHIEAIKTVYPKLYAQMQNEVMNQLMEQKGKKDFKLAYPRKMALSLFLGSDLDNALSQPEIMKNQLALTKKQSENADNKMMNAPSIKPSAAGMRELTSSNRSLTAMQSIAAGGKA